MAHLGVPPPPHAVAPPQPSENPGLALPFARRLQTLKDKVHFGSVLFSCHVRKVRGEQSCPATASVSPPPPSMSPHLALSPQINRFGKSRDRAILLTDQHLYKLDPRQQYRVMRALPLSTVSVPNPTGVPRVWGGKATPYALSW